MKIGYLLIIFGVAVLALGTALSMSTAIWVNVVNSVPCGTLTEPEPMSLSDSVFPSIGLGASIDEPLKVVIDCQTLDYQTEMPLSFFREFMGIYFYVGASSWSFPPNTTIGITFVFTFKVNDEPLHTAYLVSSDITGYFTINGQRMEEDSTIIVTDPTLNIQFYDESTETKQIQGVHIEVTNTIDHLRTLNKVSGRLWEIEYTLPEQGAYNIRGYFTKEIGESVTVMNVYASYGLEDGENGEAWNHKAEPLPLMNQVTIFGLGMIICGVVLTAIKRR